MGTAPAAELTIRSGGAVQAPSGGQVPADVAAAVSGDATQRRKPSPRQVAPKPNAETASLHQAQHERHAAAAEPDDTSMVNVDEAAAALPAVREDVETIEFNFPDGRAVVFGPPSGVSLTARVAMLMAGGPPSDEFDVITRCLLSVRTIDGKRLPPITNRVDVQKCANIIGDNNLDILGYLLKKHWPPVNVGELPQIKKNLRGREV